MTKPQHPRKKIFVNSQFQGRILLRIAMYWGVYHFLLWHMLFFFECLRYRVGVMNGGDVYSLAELYGLFTLRYYPVLFSALSIVPLFLLDSVKFSHRVAGPLVRFQNTLRRMRAGERVDLVRLRPKDLLREFQDEFNAFITYYNAQQDRRERSDEGAACVESCLLQEVHEMQDSLEPPVESVARAQE